MIVPCDLPVHYYALYAIQKVHFIIMLISFSSQNERYNEVSVYVTSAPSLTVFRKHLKTYLFSRFFPQPPVVLAQWLDILDTIIIILTYLLFIISKIKLLNQIVKLWSND